MKEVMNSNIYDVNETIIIVGSCLKDVQPIGFEKLKEMSEHISNLFGRDSYQYGDNENRRYA